MSNGGEMKIIIKLQDIFYGFIALMLFSTAALSAPTFVGKADPCTFVESREDYLGRSLNCYGNPTGINYDVRAGEPGVGEISAEPEPEPEPVDPPDKEPKY